MTSVTIGCRLRIVGACALAMLLLAGCDYLPDWFTGSKDKEPLPGKRIDVLSEISLVKPDDSLQGTNVTIPDIKTNDNWRQAGGGPQGVTGNLQISGFTHHDSTRIGDGNAWEEPFYTSPVIAAGTVFAMDAKGYITAHDAMNIDKVRWTNKSAVSKHEPDLLGGGLAYDNGRIYATSGRGKVVALDATTGKEIWKQAIGVPLRAAPKVGGSKVYVLSVDNQLFALDSENGIQIWSHRGINENAGFLADISPAVTESIVIAPYSSGEIHALDNVSGQDIWNDVLIRTHRTLATGVFSGIGGNPIVKDDIVYAAGSNGFFAALSLLSGRRLWEQDVSSLNTPWIAGDFVYLLSNENELLCMTRADGRIKWIRQLPRYEDEKKRKNPFVWRGPIMAGGQLLVAGQHGQMLAIAPKDGTTLSTVEIPENITDMPVIAGGRLYMLTQDAKLHVLY